MSEMKNIPTKYGGRTFKSKFEAQFAAYLDIMGISYKYEIGNKKITKNATYKPDFYIPQNNFYVEVKGKTEYMEMGIAKVDAFSSMGNDVLIFGPEWPWDLNTMRNDFENDSRFHSSKYMNRAAFGGNDVFFVVQNLIPGYALAQPYDLLIDSFITEAEKNAFDDCLNKAMKVAFDYFVGKDAMEDKDRLSPKEIADERFEFMLHRNRSTTVIPISKKASRPETDNDDGEWLIDKIKDVIMEEFVDRFIEYCKHDGTDFKKVLAQMIFEWIRRYDMLFYYNKSSCSQTQPTGKEKTDEYELPF